MRGGLGVCVIMASAALGAAATIATRSQPGLVLGLFVLAGTVAAALTVEPRAGRLIFPVPALVLPGRRAGGRRDVQPVREQHRARGRRGPVDRQRVLRHGAGHPARHRADHGALVPVAPLRAGPARCGLAGRGQDREAAAARVGRGQDREAAAAGCGRRMGRSQIAGRAAAPGPAAARPRGKGPGGNGPPGMGPGEWARREWARREAGGGISVPVPVPAGSSWPPQGPGRTPPQQPGPPGSYNFSSGA